MFCSSVDEQNLPEVSKFKSVLKGPVLLAVQGLPVTAENYILAVNLLREKFGRKVVIIESLYSKLQRLPKSGNKFKKVRYVSETIERHLRPG